MGETDMKIPVFVIHGFLEGGKTRFALETLADEYFPAENAT